MQCEYKPTKLTLFSFLQNNQDIMHNRQIVPTFIIMYVILLFSLFFSTPCFPCHREARYVGLFRYKNPLDVLVEQAMVSEVQQLETFVKESLQKGCSKKDIAQALEGAGWPIAQINSSIEAYADIAFPIAVPKPRPSLSARDAFLYLVLFSTLYYGSWHLGSLLFSFIDKAYPNPTDSYYPSIWDSRRWSTAAIIIAFPVFFYLSYYIGVQIKKNPLKRLSPIRRWLTYITLFIAAVTLLGDTTTLVFNLLGGDLTIRFILKILTVAIISGTGFVYYLLDLRKEERECAVK